MIKGEKGEPLSAAAADSNGEEKAVTIMRTTHIYCGKPTGGYEVARGGLHVVFTPHLGEVHRLIDEYYDGGRTGSNRREGN